MSQYDQSNTRGLQRHRPDEVGAFASTVISVLRDRQVGSPDGVRKFVVDHLVRAILGRGRFDPVQLLEEMRDHRLTLDMIIDLYIPQAATVLGDSWVSDDISFADVTVGALRLQSLLGEASGQVQFDLCTDDTRVRAMVVLPRGEQHFLGVSVVAAQLRRAGCEVSVSFDETLGHLSVRLLEECPGLVLISCARLESLESVAETVQTVRASAPADTVIALGGAVLREAAGLKEQTGVDIVTQSARDAIALCPKRGAASSFT